MKTESKNLNFIIKMIGVFIALLFLVAAGYYFLINNQTFAQSPTPEATPTPEESTDPETEEPIEDKIKDIRNAVKEKVQEKLDEVKKGQKRAFVGEITEIANSTLTVATNKGERQVKVSEETTIISLKRNEVELEDLAIDDRIIAMGYLETNEILDGRRIVVTSTPEVTLRDVAYGFVTDISDEENVLSVKNPKKNITYTIEVTTKTTITKKMEDEVEEVEFEDIEENDRLVAIGTTSENEEKIITAKIIHIIPGKATGLIEKVAEELTPTPSPEPTPEEEIEEEEE